MDDLLQSRLRAEMNQLDSAISLLRLTRDALHEAGDMLRATEGRGWQGAAATKARERTRLARRQLQLLAETCEALRGGLKSYRATVETKGNFVPYLLDVL